MPVYNGQSYLSSAIESILSQTFKDFEFIIVDDGSTDETTKIVTQFKERDNRIKFIHQEHEGIVAALNKGISSSVGEFIARMDSDDICLPERLELQRDFFEANPEIGVLGTDYYILQTDKSYFHEKKKKPSSNLEIYWALCFSNPIAHPSVMVRRRVFDMTDGYRTNFQFAEDYDLWMRLVDKERFFIIPKCLVMLRKHDKNVTNIHYDESLSKSIEISVKVISKLLSVDLSKEVVKPLWLRQSPHENLIAAFCLLDLNKKFVSKFSPGEGEIGFIENATISFLAELANLRSFKKESIIILLQMFKYDFFKSLSFWCRKAIERIERIYEK